MGAAKLRPNLGDSGYATHCSMQLSLQQWRGALRAVRAGQGSGEHRCKQQHRGAPVTGVSTIEGMCLQIMKCNQQGLEALCMRTGENQSRLRVETYTGLVGH